MDTLPKSLKSALKKGFGIKRLYPLQNNTLSFLSNDPVTDGNPRCALQGLTGDAVINAPTGYGKTMAYLLPVFKYLVHCCEIDGLRSTTMGVRAIILVPNHELVQQVYDTIQLLIGSMKKGDEIVTCANLKGGQSWVHEVRQLFSDNHVANIIVSTPARMAEHLNGANMQDYLEHLRFLIFDEADMLIENHLEDLTLIIDQLSKVRQGTTKKIRKVLCSATITAGAVMLSHVSLQCPRYFSLEDGIADNGQVASVMLPTNLDCFLWRIRGKNAKCLEHVEEDIKSMETHHDRDVYLWHVLRDFWPKWAEGERLRKTKLQRLNKIPKCIIFVNSRDSAISLSARLNKQYVSFAEQLDTETRKSNVYAGGISVALHPAMRSKDRSKTLASFLDNTRPILISTDLTGRGIDDLTVEMVISYEPPNTISNLIHRSGRTARAGDYGTAIHFCDGKSIGRIMHGVEEKAKAVAEQIMNYESVLMPGNDEEEVMEDEQEEMQYE